MKCTHHYLETNPCTFLPLKPFLCLGKPRRAKWYHSVLAGAVHVFSWRWRWVSLGERKSCSCLWIKLTLAAFCDILEREAVALTSGERHLGVRCARLGASGSWSHTAPTVPPKRRTQRSVCKVDSLQILTCLPPTSESSEAEKANVWVITGLKVHRKLGHSLVTTCSPQSSDIQGK